MRLSVQSPDRGLEGARPECLEPLAPHFLASQHVMYGWNVFTKRKAKAGASLARAHVQVSQVQVLFQQALTGLKRGPETPMGVPQGLNDVRPARLEMPGSWPL